MLKIEQPNEKFAFNLIFKMISKMVKIIGFSAGFIADCLIFAAIF